MRNKKLLELPPIPEKRFFRMGEAAELCGVAESVLRYWETQFTELKPMRRGLHRKYRVKDIEVARRIRELLYGQGFTIAGAKEILEAEKEQSQAQKDSQAASVQSVLDVAEVNEVLERLRKLKSFLRGE